MKVECKIFSGYDAATVRTNLQKYISDAIQYGFNKIEYQFSTCFDNRSIGDVVYSVLVTAIKEETPNNTLDQNTEIIELKAEVERIKKELEKTQRIFTRYELR